MFNEALYNELVQTRNNIREQSRNTPLSGTICSNSVLAELARRLPQTPAEIREIPGTGGLFTHNCFNAFLDVIKNNLSQMPVYEADMEILDIMEAGKSIFSKEKESESNMLVYTTTLTAKTAFDLYYTQMMSELEHALHNSNAECRPITICDCSTTNPNELAYQISLSKPLTSLVREAKRDMLQKGKSTVYIGYPLIYGKLSTGTTFRAPLTLIPAALQAEGGEITLTIDKARLALFNPMLSAAIKKDKTIKLHESKWRNKAEYAALIERYCESLDLKIDTTRLSGNLTPYDKKIPGDAPAEIDSFTAYPYALLGRFNIGDIAVSEECGILARDKNTTPLVNSLFSYDGLLSSDTSDKAEAVADADCVYPADLYQRKAIAMARKTNFALICPPSTGATHTVANIVLSSILNDPYARIAIVSDSRTALDAVHERLGEARQYAIQQFDAHDIQEARDRLITALKHPVLTTCGVKNLQEIKEKTQQERAYYTKCLEKTEYKITNGVYPKALYLRAVEKQRINYRNATSISKSRSYVKDYACSTSLKVIDTIHKKMVDAAYVSNYANQMNMLSSAPVLQYMQLSLSNEAVIEMTEQIRAVHDVHDKWEHRKKYIPAFLTKKHKDPSIDAAKAIAEQYYTEDAREEYESIYKISDTALDTLLGRYRKYRELYGCAKPLTAAEREYLKLLFETMKVLNLTNSGVANDILRDSILHEIIANMERDNKEYQSAIKKEESFMNRYENSVAEMQAQNMNAVIETLGKRVSSFLESESGKELLASDGKKALYTQKDELKAHIAQLVNYVNIWETTPDALSALFPLKSGLFDIVIYLDAAHIQATHALPSVFRANHIIVVGDPAQDESKLGERKSMLDLAIDRLPHLNLKCYYGMGRTNLADYNNARFYKNNIAIVSDASETCGSAVSVEYVADAKWENDCNEREAKHVVEIVRKTMQNEPDTSIGIISFSVRQKNRIIELLREEAVSDSDVSRMIENYSKKNSPDLFVANTREYTHEMRDLIIISATITPGMLSGEETTKYEWQTSFNDSTLNISCSHARKRVIIVSSVTQQDLDTVMSPGTGLTGLWGLLDLAAHGNEAPARKESDITAVSTIVDAIAERLAFSNYIDAYICDRDIGKGPFKVDVALRSVNSPDKYALGILFNPKKRKNAEADMEYRICRHQYLRARHWELMYLHIEDWYRNREGCLQMIARRISEIEKKGQC